MTNLPVSGEYVGGGGLHLNLDAEMQNRQEPIHTAFVLTSRSAAFERISWTADVIGLRYVPIGFDEINHEADGGLQTRDGGWESATEERRHRDQRAYK